MVEVGIVDNKDKAAVSQFFGVVLPIRLCCVLCFLLRPSIL
jgi:hypothetical protein